VQAQSHPRIYVTNESKANFENRIASQSNVQAFVADMHAKVDGYVLRHKTDPEWIISRLQMYWNTKYKNVYVKGMDYSHGDGSAPVPTVRFSGSRDWDTDYLVPSIEDIKPYMDDPRGLYLQNDRKSGKPWEWTHPSETGHVVENINYKILHLAEEAAFLYWLEGKEEYAVFASDIILTYVEGMYHRNPPQTVDGHHNKDLMGLQTFEVIHEKVIEPLTIGFDFLHEYLDKKGKDLNMIQAVFKKWADQEIKYGVPGNNWNLMQARYITYLALALESDDHYSDNKGQEYYIDQVLNQNSRKQKALKDVLLNFDPSTGIWPEVASYSIMVSDDILEVYCLMDKTLNNDLLGQYPMLEKAILANFNYLFPDGYTTAYGDAKHSRLRFSALELLITQYRKYNRIEKENLITAQLKRFIKEKAYSREKINSLFQLFYYVKELNDVPASNSIAEIVNPTFYSPNVSWIVQRNGHSLKDGMMISKNASLGNHSHANGINIELFAKGMVVATDCARGNSYWAPNHREYYSRFPAHNTVIVDGISDYKTMSSSQAFRLKSIYPQTWDSSDLLGGHTFSDVIFNEPATDATQQRMTSTIRTSESSGYFVDIFRSERNDKQDKKHEYLYHSHGKNITISDFNNQELSTLPTEELSSKHGDLVGYDYFTNKKAVAFSKDFSATFSMPSIYGYNVKTKLYMKGYEDRSIYTVEAPYSRADSKDGISPELYQQPIPTLIVRQKGEAASRPFVSIIDVFTEDESTSISNIDYFDSYNEDPDIIGIEVSSSNGRTDYLYHAPASEKPFNFKNSEFIGTYAVASYNDEKMTSLFLGQGLEISRDQWSIKSSKNEGGIILLINGNQLLINAEKPFQLSIPAELLKGTPTLESIDAAGTNKNFSGQVELVHGSRVVLFHLPILDNAQFVLNH